ncbi:MAG: tRNA lysidine(34) synthetase TilS [Brachymonas sp.]|nr:tRNA lysidine(34) synthetase TilS [Brachymonas sp.]
MSANPGSSAMPSKPNTPSAPVASAPAATSFAALRGLIHWPASKLDATLQHWWHKLPQPRPQHLAVAFSGGADSTALLLGLLRLHHASTATSTSADHSSSLITALHVHHGLQACADDFANYCALFCAALQPIAASIGCDLQYQSLHVHIALKSGDSLEACARDARYRALAQTAQSAGAETVLLGQHADDQAESVLLALSRGAGVAGLAGMPAAFSRHGTRFARPLLAIEQSAIKHWLQTQHVPWIEDPSNTDLRFTRNRLRHAVLPALEKQLPGFSANLIRSARLAAQADALLQELAAIDLQQIGNPPHIAQLQQLSPHRQANALRHWLKSEYNVIGSESQMLTLLQIIAACQTRGHHIHIKVGPGYVVRSGPTLQWQPQ